MPFNFVDESLEYLIVLISVIGVLLCFLIFYFSHKNVKPSIFKKKFQIITFYLIMGYLLPALGTLPISLKGKIFFNYAGFVILAFFPFLIGLLLIEDKKFLLKNAFIFKILLLIFGISIIYPFIAPYLLFFVFLPAWFYLIALVFDIYQKSILISKRRLLFFLIFSIFIGGFGLFFDCITVNKFQEIPILTYIFPLWVLFILLKIKDFSKLSIEPMIGEGAIYGIIPFLIMLSLIIYFGVRYFFIRDNSLDSFNSFSLWVSFGVSIVLSFAFGHLVIKVPKLINNLSLRFMSPLEREFIYYEKNINKKFDLAQAKEWLLKYTDMDFVLWFRQRNSFYLIFFKGGESSPFSNKDFIVFDKNWDKNYIILNPENLENRVLNQPLFRKFFSLSEKSDILLIPSEPLGKNFLPLAVMMIYKKKTFPFIESEIRNLNKIVLLLDKWIREFQKELFSYRYINPLHLSNIKSVKELFNEISKNSNLILKNSSIGLYFKRENESSGLFYHNSSEYWGKYENYKVEGRDFAGMNILTIEKSKERLRELSLNTSLSNAKLIFLLKEDFVYEDGDKEYLEKISELLGFIIDKIIITKEFQNEAKKLKRQMDYTDQLIKNQRFRMAQEIHDTVAQDVYAARIQLDLINKHLRDNSSFNRQDLKLLHETVSQNLSQVRKIIKKLRKPQQEEDCLKELIVYFEILKKEKGMSVEHHGLEDIKRLENELGWDLCMVIREGINNIRKHSKASRVIIRFRKTANKSLSLLIIDDGIGFDVSKIDNESFGLLSMRARCERNNFNFNFRSQKGKGTILYCFGKGKLTF